MNDLEHGLDFDRTWKGRYTLLHCEDFNRPIIGHQQEKYRHTEGGYEKETVDRFERAKLNIEGIRKECSIYNGWKVTVEENTCTNEGYIWLQDGWKYRKLAG